VGISISIDNATSTTKIKTNIASSVKGGQYLEFSISVKDISEIDPFGNNVTYDLLSNYSFTTSVNQSDLITYYNITYALPTATLVISIVHYTDAQTITFANQSTHIPANGLKFYYLVENWPFIQLANRLALTLSSSSNSNNSQDLKVGEDSSGNLLWMEVSVCDASLYSTYNNHALLDDKVRTVQFRLKDKSSSDVQIIVPHFWNFAEIYSDYSVLVSPTNACSGSSDNSIPKNTIIAIVVPIVGVVLIVLAITGTLAIRRRNKRRSLSKEKEMANRN